MSAILHTILHNQFYLTAVIGLVIAVAVSIFFFERRWKSGAKNKAVIASIGTANPAAHGSQQEFVTLCKTLNYPEEVDSLLEKIAARSGIDNRHTVVTGDPQTYMGMITGGRKRAALWEEWSRKLGIAAARAALARWHRGTVADITHVVVHSCTGFSAPGLDYYLIKDLGLPSTTRKLGVNFMGCFGGFTSLYVASQIIEADTTGKAVVLAVCSETCSVHFTTEPKLELVIGNSLFADGAAAAIITHAGFQGHKQRHSVGEGNEVSSGGGGLSGASTSCGNTTSSEVITNITNTASAQNSTSMDFLSLTGGEWEIGSMASEIIAKSEHCMSWKAGQEVGLYEMWLDKSIPSMLSSTFATTGVKLLLNVGILNPWTVAWCIHPGGKAIISAFEKALTAMGLPSDGLSCSSEVLRQYGNMSSATIFFVLDRVLTSTKKDTVFMAGFGPGLTVEYGALRRRRAAGHADRPDDEIVPEAVSQAVPDVQHAQQATERQESRKATIQAATSSSSSAASDANIADSGVVVGAASAAKAVETSSIPTSSSVSAAPTTAVPADPALATATLAPLSAAFLVHNLSPISDDAITSSPMSTPISPMAASSSSASSVSSACT